MPAHSPLAPFPEPLDRGFVEVEVARLGLSDQWRRCLPDPQQRR